MQGLSRFRGRRLTLIVNGFRFSLWWIVCCVDCHLLVIVDDFMASALALIDFNKARSIMMRTLDHEQG